MKLKEYLNESSLSRVWKHNDNHDCGAMTAFRKVGDCGDGNEYTRKENNARNKSLLAKLKTKGYGIIKLKGKYPEGGVTRNEDLFFIVDLKDNENLLKDMKKFGEQFEQDSILFISKGSVGKKNNAFLIGTNHCKNNEIKFGQKISFEKGMKFGYESPIYTSFVNGRPFIAESMDSEITGVPGNGMGWWALELVARKNWTELIE